MTSFIVGCFNCHTEYIPIAYLFSEHDKKHYVVCPKCYHRANILKAERVKIEDSMLPQGAEKMPAVVMDKKHTSVSVRWWDGYFEKFECEEVRFGCSLLWLRLKGGQNRHIPLAPGSVRWYSVTPESHERKV